MAKTKIRVRKMHFARIWVLLSLILLFVCLAPLHRAHAYVDPGTGNYLLQLIVAGMFGALFAIKIFWARLKGAWGSVQAILFKNRQSTAE